MFDVKTYLAHLGYSGPIERTAQLLRELHKRHLMSVPFDNALKAKKGLAIWDDVDIDVDAVFKHIILDGNGGVCHELSGLFRTLLRELGFDITIMSAGVRGANGTFGPNLEHMFICVLLDGETWLVDVGFAGPSFIEPLRLTDDVQHQYGCQYRITEDGGYHVVQRKGQVDDWKGVYRFKLQARQLVEWKEIPSLVDSDPVWHWFGELVAAGTIIRGRSFDNGQMLLVGKRYLTVDGGHEKIRVLVKPDEYENIVNHILRQDD